jgi:hypothetical protein
MSQGGLVDNVEYFRKRWVDPKKHFIDVILTYFKANMDSESGHVMEIQVKYLDDIPPLLVNYIKKNMSAIVNFAGEGYNEDSVTLRHVVQFLGKRGYQVALENFQKKMKDTTGVDLTMEQAASEFARNASKSRKQKALENWDTMFADFQSHKGMPAKGTTMHNWKQNQLSSRGAQGLEAKITADVDSNEWKERKDKLVKCIEIKKHADALENWDTMFADFQSHKGMPAIGTTMYNWKQNQLSSGGAQGLEAKITADVDSNEWKERKDKLVKCIEIKKHADALENWDTMFADCDRHNDV